ncbi:MAG: hypothetical protein GY825_12145 [Phycisphaeraceae bacterium]|nr:hypothetical protein [Phycisphaeraceae bacterium]
MSILATAVAAATILLADPPPPCCSSPTSQTTSNAPTEPPTPTSDYDVRSMRGWTVRVNPAIATEDPALLAATLEELDHQLYMITRVIPKPALDRIRDIEIWVELDMPKTACMCYHVSKDWLIPNGYNGDKEGTVEIGNARAFLDWTKGQPWMVLHELAHGYHDQVFGYDDPMIIAGWRRMAEQGVYDRVGHISGKPRRHYALTNQMEWFAETTEALYGTNDFHPYVRSELREVDPEGARIVRQRWELDPIPAPTR